MSFKTSSDDEQSGNTQIPFEIIHEKKKISEKWRKPKYEMRYGWNRIYYYTMYKMLNWREENKAEGLNLSHGFILELPHRTQTETTKSSVLYCEFFLFSSASSLIFSFRIIFVWKFLIIGFNRLTHRKEKITNRKRDDDTTA